MLCGLPGLWAHDFSVPDWFKDVLLITMVFSEARPPRILLLLFEWSFTLLSIEIVYASCVCDFSAAEFVFIDLFRVKFEGVT